MEAQTLRCPGCGAAAASDAPSCGHCGSRLATVSCPSCFGLMFLGSRHCPHCGAKAARAAAEGPALPCPRCRAEMQAVQVGSARVQECPACSGVWLDTETFAEVCTSREEQAAVLHFSAASAPAREAAPEATVRYVPCPACGKLMNRVNFQRISGVVVDVCREHGTWFDADELRRIVEFIRAGGLEAARERERQSLEWERRRLEAKQRETAAFIESAPKDLSGGSGATDDVLRGVLRFLGLG
jgi:Zn-finger nucleic acid-binding protein